MMNLFKLFLKPIDVSALDDMRLSDIMKLTGRLQDGNKIIVLAKDKGHRVSQLQHIIADRIKLLIGWSGQADVSTLTIDCCGSISVFDEEFNKMVREYATEHKLYHEVSSWAMGISNGINDTLAYSYHFNPENQEDTLAVLVKVITEGIVNAHRSFDNLQRIVRNFDWAIPVVEYIRVYPSGDDDWGAPVWHIESGKEYAVAICTGSGTSELEEARERGYNMFITGEIRESTPIYSAETGMAVIAAGHHRSEIFGVENIANWLIENGVDAKFIDLDNPI